MSLKNNGQRLITIARGIVDNIPQRWRSKLTVTEIKQKVPLDIGLTELGEGLVSSRVAQDQTNERQKVDTFLDSPIGQTMVEYIRTKDGQVGTRTLRYLPEGTPLPTIDELVIDAGQEASGNGYSEQFVTTIPNLLGLYDYRVERPDRVPPEFGALLNTIEESHTVAGQAALPTLGPGELMREERQIDAQTKRVTVRYRNLASLPITIISYETDRDKEIVQVTRTWQLASVSPFTPTATRDTVWEPLGDAIPYTSGTAIQTQREKAVFPGPVYGKSIENLIPPKFRAHIPTVVEEITVTGLAHYLPLASGEMSHEEQQLDEFNKRVKTVTFDPSGVPITHTDKELNQEYGGSTLDVIYTLHTQGTLAIQEGLLFVSCEIVDLGNGFEVRTTRKAEGTEWPELVGTEVDPRTGIIVGIAKKVVAAGTTGGVAGDVYTDIKPLEKWRSIQIASTLNTGSLPADKVWETSIEHRFDNTLLGIAWIWASASAPFAYDFDMVPIMDIVQGYTGPCRAKITESFSNGPPAAVVTPTVFCPQGHTIGFAWAFAADIEEDCGGCVGIARAHAQAWSIPATLHDEIDLTGTVTLDGGTFTSTLPATCPTGLPAAGTLITKACDVEEWRFGVFYRRLVEVYVPDCTCL